MPDDYPPIDGGYRLRFTRRALDDLGCPALVAAGSIEDVRRSTTHKAIVDKFATQRSVEPTGTEARAANDELLPSLDDEVTLEIELEELDFHHRVTPDLRQLVARAEQSPNQPQRATVGALLRLDVCVELLVVADDAINDLTISVRLPPVVDAATSPPDWSDVPLLERLVALIDPTGLRTRSIGRRRRSRPVQARKARPTERSTPPESWPFACRIGRCESTRSNQ